MDDRWMDGWMDGWMDERIVVNKLWSYYFPAKSLFSSLPLSLVASKF